MYVYIYKLCSKDNKNICKKQYIKKKKKIHQIIKSKT